jgi:hypothetical protein
MFGVLTLISLSILGCDGSLTYTAQVPCRSPGHQSESQTRALDVAVILYRVSAVADAYGLKPGPESLPPPELAYWSKTVTLRSSGNSSLSAVVSLPTDDKVEISVSLFIASRPTAEMSSLIDSLQRRLNVSFQKRW